MSFKSLKGVVTVALIAATLLLAVPADAAADDREIQTRTEFQTNRIEARTGFVGFLTRLWDATFSIIASGGSKLDPDG